MFLTSSFSFLHLFHDLLSHVVGIEVKEVLLSEGAANDDLLLAGLLRVCLIQIHRALDVCLHIAILSQIPCRRKS